uniref:NADH-ubiquinone oxidoreductase chain 4L n=1 Tax=Amblyomma fimbriatum TaxID=65641 RepID=H9M771_9ACAR|nr:NADH dehydrogenase subunit 4L [Amblyomma fimbriatum]AET63088.1 NADH dehydrogenase subunit 4L [Amblyomma fimbriatum]
MMMSSLVLYLIGVISLILNRFHLIMILMSLEFIYMSIMILMLFVFSLMNIMNVYMYLVSIVCEASMGLCLLVFFNFFYGNELINSFNLMKC